MAISEPSTKLDARFSSPNAEAKPWAEATDILKTAEIYWVTTVRPDGRPHVTPAIGAWLDGAFLFSTGPDEQKAHNLAANPHCLVTTGCNRMHDAVDIVLEGEAVRVTDEARLQSLVGLYDAKYAPMFHFEVKDDTLSGAWAFEVRPHKVLGFGRARAKEGEADLFGGVFSQTTWRFDA
jgi:hypothetical protein